MSHADLGLLVILFFSFTGITLNHLEWTFGIRDIKKEFKGKLMTGAISGDRVDWLKVVEQLRKEQPVKGAATDMRVDGDEGSLSFKSPGYSAECFFKLADGSYQRRTTSQGLVAVMHDLHRGRDSGTTWSWLIDVSGFVLVFVSLTGLGMMFYLKKSRVAAFILCGVGAGLFVALLAAASK